MGNGDEVVVWREMGAMRRREEGESRCSGGRSRVGREGRRWGEGNERIWW